MAIVSDIYYLTMSYPRLNRMALKGHQQVSKVVVMLPPEVAAASRWLLLRKSTLDKMDL